MVREHMKKLLTALAAVFLILLGTGCTVLWPQDTPGESGTPQQPQSAQAEPELNVKQKAANYAEMLESLDYEIMQNRDTVGWLKIPGTDINNSVLQSYDNAYYLRRDERRRDEVYGCYFADYECSTGEREDFAANTVIYGHSDMKDNPDGRRFSQLFKFLDPSFAEMTPCIQFCTAQAAMEWQVFAVFYTDVSFDYIQVNLDGDELVALADAAKKKSIYDYGVQVEPGDRILTLSTCTVHFSDSSHRFVVMAKLLGEDEEAPVQAFFTEHPENR